MKEHAVQSGIFYDEESGNNRSIIISPVTGSRNYYRSISPRWLRTSILIPIYEERTSKNKIVNFSYDIDRTISWPLQTLANLDKKTSQKELVDMIDEPENHTYFLKSLQNYSSMCREKVMFLGRNLSKAEIAERQGRLRILNNLGCVRIASSNNHKRIEAVNHYAF